MSDAGINAKLEQDKCDKPRGKLWIDINIDEDVQEIYNDRFKVSHTTHAASCLGLHRRHDNRLFQ